MRNIPEYNFKINVNTTLRDMCNGAEIYDNTNKSACMSFCVDCMFETELLDKLYENEEGLVWLEEQKIEAKLDELEL